MNAMERVLDHGNSLFDVVAMDKRVPTLTSTEVVEIPSVVQSVFNTKYPPGSIVTKVSSTLQIKQMWLHSEWIPECQFSKLIREAFPCRDDLRAENTSPNIDLISSTFDRVRGKYILWQSPREEARWKKVVTKALDIEWVVRNVEVLYPSVERFQVSELNGIVLWNEPSNGGKKYKLYEGNHRISTWIASKIPQTLPAVIFIGKPKKLVR
jgi:hypothetical protein